MQNYVFGADIGGTSVKLGLFTNDGRLVEKWEIPTRTANGGVHVLPDVVNLAIFSKVLLSRSMALSRSRAQFCRTITLCSR